MPPRLPLRCHLHDNSQHVLKSSSQRRLRLSTSAAPKSTNTSADTSADTNASSSGPYAKDEGQTWRMRADGRRKLPLPPILDPIAISQRERWIEPKKPAAAPAERTPFQKKLYNNAFAHMLSTPIRKDHKLGLQLPSHFLVPFRPLKHPSTAEIWLLPGAGLKPTKAAGSFNAWAVARRAHLRALCTAKRGAFRGLTGPAQGSIAQQSRGNTVWRADMDELVLRMLRENVVQQLRYGFSRPRGGGVIKRLWEEPGKGFVRYNPSEHERPRNIEERAAEGEEQARRSLPSQLSQHAAPAALLFLRPLTPLSAHPSDVLAQSIAACDGLVDDLVDHKTYILRKLYPDFSPAPHSKWAHAEQLHPRLDPRFRVGRLRPSVVRWTPPAEAGEASKEGEAAKDSEASKAGAVKHAHLIPVYSLPDLLGGEEAFSTLLGGERSEQSEQSKQTEPSMQSKRRESIWGRGAVLLKAGPGAIGALLALERLRSYVEVPW
ncbi:hypothetical protein IWX90DRAFT_262160 [Phyllosticta citrichinensis]|uniref:Uncharacterized protein n=1 Tax=Phyllosticta citrichinensis TaxID=1130410 RepID=A0ABR1XSB6_9PEZI